MPREIDPRRIYWFAPPIIGLCIVSYVGILVASTSFSYRHWQMPDAKFTVTRDGHVVAPQLASSNADTEANTGTAVAVTPEPEYRFPVMNPLTTASHEFVIRNDGDAPLLLRNGPTTCKCTVAKLGHSSIPPGKEGRVKLVWNSGRKPTAYTQTAMIYTNDPERPEIRFTIFGQVRVRLASLPAEVTFGNLAPDEPRTQDLTLITRHWHHLEFVSATSTIPGLRWEVVSTTPETLERHQAADAVQLQLHSPPAAAASPYFEGTLTLRLKAFRSDADPNPEDETIEVSVRGKHLGRLGIYGADVDSLGQVDLGKVDRGELRTSRLVLRVRDVDPELNVEQVDVEPSFVQTEVSRHPTRPGTYFVDLTVPDDAPDYIGSTGRVRIVVNHPRITSPELKLDLSIMDYAQ